MSDPKRNAPRGPPRVAPRRRRRRSDLSARAPLSAVGSRARRASSIPRRRLTLCVCVSSWRFVGWRTAGRGGPVDRGAAGRRSDICVKAVKSVKTTGADGRARYPVSAIHILKVTTRWRGKLARARGSERVRACARTDRESALITESAGHERGARLAVHRESARAAVARRLDEGGPPAAAVRPLRLLASRAPPVATTRLDHPGCLARNSPPLSAALGSSLVADSRPLVRPLVRRHHDGGRPLPVAAAAAARPPYRSTAARRRTRS